MDNNKKYYKLCEELEQKLDTIQKERGALCTSDLPKSHYWLSMGRDNTIYCLTKEKQTKYAELLWKEYGLGKEFFDTVNRDIADGVDSIEKDDCLMSRITNLEYRGNETRKELRNWEIYKSTNPEKREKVIQECEALLKSACSALGCAFCLFSTEGSEQSAFSKDFIDKLGQAETKIQQQVFSTLISANECILSTPFTDYPSFILTLVFADVEKDDLYVERGDKTLDEDDTLLYDINAILGKDNAGQGDTILGVERKDWETIGVELDLEYATRFVRLIALINAMIAFCYRTGWGTEPNYPKATMHNAIVEGLNTQLEKVGRTSLF